MEKPKLSKQLIHSIANYGRMGIIIEILEMTDNEAKIKVTHKHAFNGYLLNQKQLVERVKKVFEHTGIKTKIYPVVYKIDLSKINIQWIKLKMLEFGLKRKDLMRQLAIDKSSLSLILNGKVELSKRTKATFYYYFLTYEINRQLREEISMFN